MSNVVTPIPHQWVSMVNGPIGMRYYCDKKKETYNKVDNPGFGSSSDLCRGCGDHVAFSPSYSAAHQWRRVKGVWQFESKEG